MPSPEPEISRGTDFRPFPLSLFRSPSPASPEELSRIIGEGAFYAILFTARSGSTWLTDLLASTGHLGHPDEFLNDPHMIAKDFDSFPDAIRQFAAQTRSQNGAVGIEFSLAQLAWLLALCEPFRFCDLPAHFFYLRRRNIVAQAISLFRSTGTGLFHRRRSDDLSSKEEAPALAYDADGIKQWCSHILNDEIAFEAIVVEHGLCNVDRFFYEDLLDDPGEVVDWITERVLGVMPDDCCAPTTDLQRIAGEESLAWEARFRSSENAFLSTIESARPSLTSSLPRENRARRQDGCENSSHIVNVATNYGDVAVFRNDKPIADGLRYYGEWAAIEIDFLLQFVAPGATVLDVGAHIGLHSIAFCSIAREVVVHAFEMNPLNYPLLEANTSALREEGRLVLHSHAIGGRRSVGHVNPVDISRPVNLGALRVQPTGSVGDVTVEILPLDEIDLPRVTLIKLDIEGMEAAALEGAGDLIARDRPRIYCEIISLEAALDIARFAGARGYEVYFVASAAFNPSNRNGNPVNLFGYSEETALLLLPQGEAAPDQRGLSRLEKVTDWDDLARAFIETPRFGDRSPGERSASYWKSRTQEAEGKHRVALGDLRQVSGELHRSRQDLAQAQKGLGDMQLRVATIESLLLEKDEAARRTASHKAAMAKERRKHLGALQLLSSERARASRLADERQREEQRRHLVTLMLQGRVIGRRRSLLGTLARRLGRSELASSCRTLERSGLFDRTYYKRTNSDVAGTNLEPVVHFILFGGYEGRRPCPEFDSAYYLSANPDVASAGINPLLHYVRSGEAEGRRPSPDFDPETYKTQTPTLAASGESPLRHFRRTNHVAARPIVPQFRPPRPEQARFDLLAKRRVDHPGAMEIDVIVPVYKGIDDTLACLASVLESKNEIPFELIVINDCSPEPELTAELRRLADAKLIRLLENERNLGFVGSVNRGMRLHPARDVLLLNSDTLVFNDWLDRCVAHRAEKVATITPFTNNGTICSYPLYCADNPAVIEPGYEDIDLLAAQINAGRSIEIPTGVGFCMFIARAALDQIGLFDEEAFGKGYGEENDFCMRATKAGWSNLHALDVFVFHSGETSFGPGASTGKKRGLDALTQKHPSYDQVVATFIRTDPARPARIALDAARVYEGCGETVLAISHTLGGGIERYLKDRARELKSAGKRLIVAVPAVAGTLRARLTGFDHEVFAPNLTDIDLEASAAELSDIFAALRICSIEIHSLVGWSSRFHQVLPEQLTKIGHRFEVFIHDYALLCPQVTMIGTSGNYCGEAGHAQCRSCLASTSRVGQIHPDLAGRAVDIEEWRLQSGMLLSQAAAIAAPSSDAARRVMRYFPELAVSARPHSEDLAGVPHAASYWRNDEPLRIIIIGAIGPHKGSDVLLACAKDALRRELPVRFVIVGYTDKPQLAELGNVEVTGQYSEEAVWETLSAKQGHIAFLPSVWPETYCYTLSIALAAGFPTMAFDLGAQAERLDRDSGTHRLLPLSVAADPGALNDALLAFGREVQGRATMSKVA